MPAPTLCIEVIHGGPDVCVSSGVSIELLQSDVSLVTHSSDVSLSLLDVNVSFEVIS